MTEAIAAAAGALLVAVLNEFRAQLRARQADRDRAEALRERLRACGTCGRAFPCSHVDEGR